jgi:hypothetical protein
MWAQRRFSTKFTKEQFCPSGKNIAKVLIESVNGGQTDRRFRFPTELCRMDFSNFETGDIEFAGWKVRITGGKGSVKDSDGSLVAEFTVNSMEQITLTSGDGKFADLALIALRSYVRYGLSCQS